MARENKDRILELTQRLEKKGIYLLARVVVLVLLFSILFFPSELKAMLNTPILLGAILFANAVLAIILLADLLYNPQKSIGSLAIKYIYLTTSLILAYGLFYYINATILQPPGVHYTNTYGEPHLEYDVFYISGSTYFTVGYGDIAPLGVYARTASVAEAFTGCLVNLVVLGKAFQSLRRLAL
ncbi:Ion channel [uncultured archaeon]|nr:Ion channel [uncultured archaeon]